MRFDVVLFKLRIFKSRSQATAAIQSGDVQLNGAAAKPSREVQPGDRVTLGGSAPRTFEILELPGRAMAKAAARALIRDVT